MEPSRGLIITAQSHAAVYQGYASQVILILLHSLEISTPEGFTIKGFTRISIDNEEIVARIKPLSKQYTYICAGPIIPYKERAMLVDELEKKLRPPEMDQKPYPPKVVILASGEKMVVREAVRDEIGVLLDTVHPLMGVAKDYYDIVAARMYAELLGWYRYRVANEFVLVGAIDGEIAGIVNSRLVDRDVGMSLHTLTVKRGLRVGAQLFAAKMEHHLEILGQKEVWIVAESPIGFRRWMIEYSLENREHLYPGVHHELGGVPTYVLTRELYNAVRDQKVSGTRPIEPELLVTSDHLKPPEEYPQIPGYRRSRQ
jgi:hypothetical protein